MDLFFPIAVIFFFRNIICLSTCLRVLLASYSMPLCDEKRPSSVPFKTPSINVMAEPKDPLTCDRSEIKVIFLAALRMPSSVCNWPVSSPSGWFGTVQGQSWGTLIHLYFHLYQVHINKIHALVRQAFESGLGGKKSTTKKRWSSITKKKHCFTSVLQSTDCTYCIWIK